MGVQEIKKGQIWKCVNDNGWKGIFTKGKEYTVTKRLDYGWCITTDNKEEMKVIHYVFDDFELVDKQKEREKALEETAKVIKDFKPSSQPSSLIIVKDTPDYYNNEKGSIYKFCNDQELNSWEFDIIKRVVRCRKKGLFKQDLEKTKHLIDLYLKEYEK